MTDSTPERTTARRLRDAIEPFHAFCYFVDEPKARYLELGLHPWASYFGQRAAPMGAVGAHVVTATFYGFSRSLVERSVPGVWDTISPAEAWEDRVRSVDSVLSALTGTWPPDRKIERAIEIAELMVGAFVSGGRPLGTAHAAMARPANLLTHLWLLASALREYRGDGHVAALVVSGVGPVESMATAGDFSNLSLGFHRRARGWSESEWNSGVERATERGWLDADGGLTPDGLEMRREVERLTDLSMNEVLGSVDGGDCELLVDTVADCSDVVVAAGAFRR